MKVLLSFYNNLLLSKTPVFSSLLKIFILKPKLDLMKHLKELSKTLNNTLNRYEGLLSVLKKTVWQSGADPAKSEACFKFESRIKGVNECIEQCNELIASLEYEETLRDC